MRIGGSQEIVRGEPGTERAMCTFPAAVRLASGDLLTEMSLWTFGLPYAELLPDGDVPVLYYTGDTRQLGIYATRVRP